MRGFFVVAAMLVALSNPAHARHRNRHWNPPAPTPAPAPAPAPVPNPIEPGSREALPPCVDNQGNTIADPNNEQILQWKQTKPNQYKDRGYIRGTLVGVYDAKKDHLHVDVFIGNDGTGQRGRDTDIEVIYNQAFGRVDPASLRPGSEVIACGDFIQSIKQSGPYPPSPLGAILHWVHKRMGGDHPHGYLMIDGRMYGQMDAPPRR